MPGASKWKSLARNCKAGIIIDHRASQRSQQNKLVSRTAHHSHKLINLLADCPISDPEIGFPRQSQPHPSRQTTLPLSCHLKIRQQLADTKPDFLTTHCKYTCPNNSATRPGRTFPEYSIRHKKSRASRGSRLPEYILTVTNAAASISPSTALKKPQFVYSSSTVINYLCRWMCMSANGTDW